MEDVYILGRGGGATTLVGVCVCIYFLLTGLNISIMQSDSGGQINILEGEGVLSVIVIKKLRMNMCLILNGCRDRAV